MKYLVDTHAFLWSIFSTKHLSQKAKNILLDLEHIKCVSVVTFWEISLKFSLGKITLKGIAPEDLPQIAQNSGFEILPLNQDVASSFHKLPKIKNKDPFDRMLAWQAIKQDSILLTADKQFSDYKKYGLRIVW